MHISHYECESQRIVCGESVPPSQMSSGAQVHVFGLGDIHLPVESSPQLETLFHMCTDTYMLKFAHLRKSYYSIVLAGNLITTVHRLSPFSTVCNAYSNAMLYK